jgi:hypothetical protein
MTLVASWIRVGGVWGRDAMTISAASAWVSALSRIARQRVAAAVTTKGA